MAKLFKLNVRVAAQTTYDVAQTCRYFATLRSGEDSITQEHILWMLDQIMSGEVSGGKAMRWLGWCQGVMCAAGCGDQSNFRDINSASMS